jgi:hypothetical protein
MPPPGQINRLRQRERITLNTTKAGIVRCISSPSLGVELPAPPLISGNLSPGTSLLWVTRRRLSLSSATRPIGGAHLHPLLVVALEGFEAGLG